MYKFISTLVFFSVLFLSFVNSQGNTPSFLAFFSSPPQGTGSFTYTKISLSDGSLIKSMTTTGQNPAPIGVYDFDGYWYQFVYQQIYTNFHPTFGPGSYSDLGYGFVLFSDYWGSGQGAFNFTVQPVGYNSKTGFAYFPAWNNQNDNLVVLGFDNFNKNMQRFFYNSTGFKANLQYTDSIIGALDAVTGNYYINYIDGSNTRSIVNYNVVSKQVSQFKFTIDAASSLAAKIYMFYTDISQTLYMVDTSNGLVTLIAVGLDSSSMTAQSKVVLSLPNTFGSPYDVPYVYVNNVDRHVIFVTKPTSTDSYTITILDLVTFTYSQVVTTSVTAQYNTALWYH